MTSELNWKFNILQVRPYFVIHFFAMLLGTLKKIQFQYYNTLVTTEYKESLKIGLKGWKLHCTMSVLGLKNVVEKQKKIMKILVLQSSQLRRFYLGEKVSIFLGIAGFFVPKRLGFGKYYVLRMTSNIK